MIVSLRFSSIFLGGLLTIFVKAMEPQYAVRGPCDNVRPGDCDPDACGGEESACEARYTRFYDPIMKVDRTRKSCRCVQEETCNSIEMYPSPGCRSYMSLNTAAQKIIKQWTMSYSEKSQGPELPAGKWKLQILL